MKPFYHLHSEGRIGFKQLSKADMGTSEKSNQTHIGLYEDVLTYLDDRDVEKDGLLIYNGNCSVCNCLFDRIANPDGSFRSPKIRKGDMGNSLVDKIRGIIANEARADWYLMWSGLESGQIVFWLLPGSSADYELITKANPNHLRVLRMDSYEFVAVKRLFEDRLNQTSTEVQKDIETAVLTGKKVKLYRKKDLEKADRLFKAIGKQGEALVAEFLQNQKNKGIISSFVWVNANSESGNPFDFIIDEQLSTELYVDVKSTRFDFNQYLYFSGDEVDFVSELKDDSKYSVYRVFDIEEKVRKMTVCDTCLDYMAATASSIHKFESEVNERKTIMQGVKLGVRPMDCFTRIANPTQI